jgi:hypothetical protein
MALSLGAAGIAAVGAARAVEPRKHTPTARHEGPATMTQKTWTLTDVAARQYVESIHLTPESVKGTPDGWSITKRRLQGGLSDGVDVIEVRNGDFRFSVLPTRGMGIWEAWQGDFRLGWKSPVEGPVNPNLVHLSDPSGLGWLDGFDELMVRCGLEYNGGPEFNPNGTVRYGLHGRIANTPAHKVEVSFDPQTGRIAVSGVVDESRLFGNKLRLASTISTQLGRSEITISDTVTNLSGEPGELELIYHTNFGVPLLDAGARIVLPAVRVAAFDQASLKHIAQWSQYGPDTMHIADACYFFELAAAEDGATLAVLRNAAGDRAVRYRFNKRELPYFTLWKNSQTVADGYVTGLEPGTNLPNNKSFEKKKGRVISLGPGESRKFQLTLDVLAGREAVAAAEKAVAELQRGVAPTIHHELAPDWSDV